jgi:hypothetical protein
MWRGDRLAADLTSVNFRSSKKRKHKNAISIVVDGQTVVADAAFWKWIETINIRKMNDQVVDKDDSLGMYLFVHFVMSKPPTSRVYTAQTDEEDRVWNRKLQYTLDNGLVYGGNTIFVESVSSLAGPSVSGHPAVGASSSGMSLDESFTVMTYNCLYTEHANKSNKISGFEEELVDRTEPFFDNPVLRINLPWNARLPRLVKNIQNKGTPDILFLQETTPKMLKDIVKHFPLYADHEIHSEIGVGFYKNPDKRNDGFCWVLYNKDRFTKTHPAYANVGGGFRFVGAHLRDTLTHNTIFVASMHLPVDYRPIKPIQDFVMSLSHPIVMGGDFNSDNVFKSKFASLTDGLNTFYNDNPDPDKFDWIVGSTNIRSLDSYANPVPELEGRWPNMKEGSDHTALWTRLTITSVGSSAKKSKKSPDQVVALPSPPPSDPSASSATGKMAMPPSHSTQGTIGSKMIIFKGFKFEMVAPAAKFTHSGMQNDLDPMYICRAAQLSPEQAWAIPTLLVTARTWKNVGPARPKMTHMGSFGEEYDEDIGSIGGQPCVICWKFPGDMFMWPCGWKSSLLQYPLPVGNYYMENDEWSKITVVSLPQAPLDEPMIKMRVNHMHYLQKNKGGDDTKVVMLGFDYFVEDMWKKDKKGQHKTGSMLTKLQAEQGITGFANHQQHHAIVMYSYIDASGVKRLLTPLTWQRLLNTPRYDAILATLLSGSPKDAHEDLIYLIEQWRDVNLTKVPFLP